MSRTYGYYVPIPREDRIFDWESYILYRRIEANGRRKIIHVNELRHRSKGKHSKGHHVPRCHCHYISDTTPKRRRAETQYEMALQLQELSESILNQKDEILFTDFIEGR